MDGQSLDNSSNGLSHRKRLTKKPPSSHHHTSALSVDGRIDAQHPLLSKTSSTSLRRAPSAPPARSPTFNASSSSSPRHLPSSSTASRSNHPSPVLPGSEFIGASPHPSHHQHQHQYQHQHQHQHQQQPVHNVHQYQSQPATAARKNTNRNSDPHFHGHLRSQPSEDFVGAPFDGAAIINRIEAIKSPTQPAFPAHPARPAPSAPSHMTPDQRIMGPPLRQSASFSAADNIASEKSQVSKISETQIAASKRYSDESKDAKLPGVLRKKSGFSGFMTSLVGSPRKPLISAPENPVHVTHVGYDSNTGQFTVSLASFSSPPPFHGEAHKHPRECDTEWLYTLSQSSHSVPSDIFQ